MPGHHSLQPKASKKRQNGHDCKFPWQVLPWWKCSALGYKKCCPLI